MSNLKLFQDQKIRSMWNEDNQQWYFSVVDVVGALTDSLNPTDYLKKMRKRDMELSDYIGTNCPHVEMYTETLKKRKTLAGSVKDIFRIIQSIPSSKAEPFKLWLSQVGYERVQEIENPELAQERMKWLYEMTDLELIFTMLGERVTTEISQKEQPKNFEASKKVAKRGGNVAGVARKQTEKELGRTIVSEDNFLFDNKKLKS